MLGSNGSYKFLRITIDKALVNAFAIDIERIESEEKNDKSI